MPPEKTEAKRRNPRGWVSTTYFAEGLPYMLVRYLSSVYLTDIGLKEAYLGFVNFLGDPMELQIPLGARRRPVPDQAAVAADR